MRVLITGITGFIGSSLVPLLTAHGHEVHGASRETLGDINVTTEWGQALSGCEAVVHLANAAHAEVDETVLHRVNIEGTWRLAEECARIGVRRVVYVSSVKVCGEESSLRAFDEADAPAPRDAYGAAKLAAERALIDVAKRTALEVVILRPPLVYGPRAKANMRALIHAIVQQWPLPLASVRNRRSLIFIGNLADAIVRCLEAPQAVGRTYLVADGDPVSTPELIRALARELDMSTHIFPFPPWLLELAGALVGRGGTVKRLTRSLEVNDSAIRRELGWRPPFTFEDGIRLTAEWFREERARASG